MKRPRKSTRSGRFGHILMNYSGPSFSSLPRDIMLNVLLRLSTKRISACKFVCKTWYDLISDPEFAKLHFVRAQPHPLIQIYDTQFQSRMLYLMQPEVDDFELMLERCDHLKYNPRCKCRVKFELDAKFRLPLRHPQMVFDDNNRYRIVNSCNGMLCLCSPGDFSPLVVCNPVTGEFINLPHPIGSCGTAIGCGFGFSRTSNTYKVVVLFKRAIGAQVHTLGTETWKEVDFSALESLESPAIYLNGFVYWPYRVESYCGISFDVENECFGVISAPAHYTPHGRVELGSLGGELSLHCQVAQYGIGVWVLKDCGWSKVFSQEYIDNERWSCGSYKFVKFLSDGALLMFEIHTNSFIYVHPKKQRPRYFKVSGTRAHLRVTTYVPSFVSIKDALSGRNVKVLRSRCGELKLQHEGVCISVSERDAHGLMRR